MTRANNAKDIRRYRAEAVAAGLCQQCRCRPQKPGCKTCVACLKRGKREKQRLVAERRDAGLCRCGAKPRRGSTTCRRCYTLDLERHRKLIAQYVAEGRCHRCGAEPRTGVHYCQLCLDLSSRMAAASRARNRAAGRCACGRKPTRGYTTCKRCREYKRRWHRQKSTQSAGATSVECVGTETLLDSARTTTTGFPHLGARGVGSIGGAGE